MEEKEMQQVKVYLTKGKLIGMSQESFGSDEAIILIHPDQVDLLIKWLQEAKKELQQN